MRYPIKSPSSIPGSGQALYLHLVESVSVPAKLTHEIWYNGCEQLRIESTHPFQGFFPIGKTFKLSYGGSPMNDYTFTGEEKNPVFVKDLSSEAKLALGISADTNGADKVFNPLFRKYEELPEKTRKDNELPALSLAKSIASFLSSKDVLFTEADVVDMLTVAVKAANSDQMRHILHGNHVAWCAARFMTTGVMEEDIRRNFYGQNPVDFYVKDIGTIMPAMLYAFAILGSDPVEVIKHLDYDLWGVDAAAAEMQKFMKTNQEERMAA
jgi:hypothetical protein